ncbi:MAG: UPF0182 family protein [Candidatus Kerfeldbacteria bacterium]|nr:UPF0182 family protein [Candidatus Kerfeldbacteria bacterium]
MTRKKYPVRKFILVAFVVLVVFSNATSIVTDWWWFSEVGYTQIFVKSLVAKILLTAGAAVVAAAWLLANFSVATRSAVPWIITLPASLFGKPVSLDQRVVKKLMAIIAAVIALIFGLVAAANWQAVLNFFAQTNFGAADPVFGKDISFYVFTLPIWQLGLGLIKALIVLTFISSVVVYVLRGMLSFRGLQALKQLKVEGRAKTHLGVLLALFMATVAAGAYLSLFRLLMNQAGPVAGAVFTDVTVRIPMLWASVIAAGLAAVAAAIWAVRGKAAALIAAVGLYLVVGIASGLVPLAVQKLMVDPNELVKETPYIKRNIAATRQAYALDAIEERDISGDKPITAADILANNLTIKNVRLWDRQPLLSTFSQIQEIRTYYEFTEVDNDRYVIDGEIRQIMLSPRELASDSLPNKNWINERLTFTHGYGVAAGPVNQVTPEGLPVLFVKDLPPKSDVKELQVTRPEIYYGELANDYVIAKTKSREFDYPKGEENVYTTYAGEGGVEVDSLLKRALFAIRFQSLKLLLSNDVTAASRILYHRTIRERVAKIAPFLTFDRDPYIIISDGQVYWIADAYTTSDRYPYAQSSLLNGRRVNYIRNSVKVVVDAYHGSVTFYQADAQDPILATYAKIYPKTFRPLAEMPAALASHLRYPEDSFALQTAVYSTYHMDDPQVFYNKEDQWEIPAIPSEGEGASASQPSIGAKQLVLGSVPGMSPRHIIMKLPGEKQEEFILMLPFTPRAKDNLSAWMVARNDGDNYGKVLVYRFPKDKLVFGPKQVIGRINQDPDISRQISLWDQGGSQVIQGPLLVIPIEESLLYVRPLYLKAEAGKIPELKRVIVAYENRIAMEETLELGLARLFGTAAKPADQKITAAVTPSIPTQDTQELMRRAGEVYEEALAAQREGNWAAYGDAIRRLGEILKQ